MNHLLITQITSNGSYYTQYLSVCYPGLEQCVVGSKHDIPEAGFHMA